MMNIQPMSVRNIFAAGREEVTAAGGLFGTSAKDTAKAFVHVYGSEPLSTMNDIARAATIGAIAESLEGSLPKELYASIALEGDLLQGKLRQIPTLSSRPVRVGTKAGLSTLGR